MISGIPKNERVWVKRITLDGNIFYLTTKENDRAIYFLYKIDRDKAIKIGKAKSPIELEEKYINK